MADEKRTVLLEINIDDASAIKSTKQLDQSIESLTGEMVKNKKEQDKLTKSGKSKVIQDKKSKTATDNLASSVKKYAKSIGPAVLAIGALVAIGKGLLDSLKTNKNAMDALKIESAALAGAMDQLQSDVGKVLSEMLGFNEVMAEGERQTTFTEKALSLFQFTVLAHIPGVDLLVKRLKEAASAAADVQAIYNILDDTTARYNLEVGKQRLAYEQVIAKTRELNNTTEDNIDLLFAAEIELKKLADLQLERLDKELVAATQALAATVEGTNARKQAEDFLNAVLLRRAQTEQRVSSQTRELLNRQRTEENKLTAERKTAAAERKKQLEDENKLAQDKLVADQKLIDDENERIEEGQSRAREALIEFQLDRREEAAETVEQLIQIELERYELLLENEELFFDDRTRLELQFQDNIARIRAKAAKTEIASGKTVADTKTSQLEQGFSNALQISSSLKGLNIQNAQLNKQIAIFETIVNTASAVVKSLNSGVPPVNYILAGITGALGASQLAAIANAKFAEGGILDGPAHSKGGVTINAEGGEAVINKTSMANPVLRAIASDINVAGGGKRFALGGLVGATAPIVDNSLDQMAKQFERAIANAPPILVTEDLDVVQNRVRITEDRSEI